MEIKKVLHYSSHFKWIFLASASILMAYAFIALPQNLLSIIGITIFLSGIYLGLDSLSDLDKMSKREKKLYMNPESVKFQRIMIFSVIIVLFLISMLFLSLKLIFTTKESSIFNDLFDIGLDCWAFILGLLCLLKSTYDKQHYVEGIRNKSPDTAPG